MNKKELEQLVKSLAERGFKDANIDAQIERQVKLNQPTFRVKHQKDFGQERMFYELFFERDGQTAGPFSLKAIKATHRMPVDIVSKVINGADTKVLDETMATIDWQQYWSGQKDEAMAETRQEVTMIMNGLARLYNSNSEEGIQVQQMLMYKYWPEEIYDLYRKPLLADMKSVHEHTYEFSMDNWQMVTAELAYLIISERIDSICNQLLSLRLDMVTVMDAEQELYKLLATNPGSFELLGSYNTQEGLVEFTIPGKKIEDWYQLETYSVTLTPYPDILHGTFNGIDSAALEVMMQQVNWDKDHELFNFHQDSEPEFRSGVYDIKEQLYRMSVDLAGAEVAELLQLKYLQGVTFFGDNIDANAWDRLESLPKRTNTFPVELEIRSAANALLGRAVCKVIEQNPHGYEEPWIRMDFTNRTGEGNFRTEQIDGFSPGKMEELLVRLPIPNYKFHAVKHGLLAGDRVKIGLETGNTIIIIANPEQRTLNLFTPDMRPIPFNFHFDPDWKPAQKQVIYYGENRSTKVQQSHKPRPNKKNKGKGL